MTDDLVKQLRKGVMCGDDPVIEEAADRIEKLETALTNIYAWYPSLTFNPYQTIKEIKVFARKALEEKDE